jgi:dihydrofolate reductase
MQKTIIAAIGNNLELGANNDLLWHLPVDFKWFISNTKGKPVIMGRKTMESLGKPLKNRLNIVISRNQIETNEGFHLVHSLDEGIQLASENSPEEIMIIGGAQIYNQFIDSCDKLIITHVNARFENADTFFPEINKAQWKCIFSEDHFKDDTHLYDFTFCIYEKINH